MGRRAPRSAPPGVGQQLGHGRVLRGQCAVLGAPRDTVVRGAVQGRCGQRDALHLPRPLLLPGGAARRSSDQLEQPHRTTLPDPGPKRRLLYLSSRPNVHEYGPGGNDGMLGSASRPLRHGMHRRIHHWMEPPGVVLDDNDRAWADAPGTKDRGHPHRAPGAAVHGGGRGGGRERAVSWTGHPVSAGGRPHRIVHEHHTPPDGEGAVHAGVEGGREVRQEEEPPRDPHASFGVTPVAKRRPNVVSRRRTSACHHALLLL
mmetsp:Transcript_10815/g.25307  ORF Transcript_10815/g.25307 Transcript_10815/m.25307 type:complete len:259 (-) Transcript_10815:3613-4389(-)